MSQNALPRLFLNAVAIGLSVSAALIFALWQFNINGFHDTFASASDALLAALSDDLNTAGALTELHKAAQDGDAGALRGGLMLVGLLTDSVPGWVSAGQDVLEGWAEQLGAAREDAMQTKDFSEVDRLKAALTEAGVEVRMSKAGVELLPASGFDPVKLEALT